MKNNGKCHTRLLTIATGVRNDRYVEHNSWRVATMLNYIAYGLEQIGRLEDVEILVSDWNSPTPMAKDLYLSPAAAHITRLFDVPDSIAHSAGRGSAYPYCVVWNSAVRRASGKFIGMSDNDSLYTPMALGMLLRILDGSEKTVFNPEQVLMAASRRQVSQDFLLSFPGVQEVDTYLSWAGMQTDEDHMSNGTCGAVGTHFMHRDLWDEFGGMDERETEWGWMDIDLSLRVTRRYPWINLTNYGVTVFHMSHPPTFMKKSGASSLKRKKTSTHQFRDPFMINPNGPDWGQGQYDLPVYATQPGNGGKIYPTTSQDWRFNRMGELTPAEILKKIAAPEIAQTLQKFLELFATQELVSFPTMAQEKRRHGKDGVVHDDYLSLLTWYVKQYRPLTYLEVGPALGLPAALTAYLNTPVHIYGFEDWNNPENPISLHPYRYTDALRVVKHHGHVRFISGSELESNVQGWNDSRIHDKLDLILYANHHPVDRIVADGKILLSHLARGGCFILRHLDTEILRAAGSLLSQSAPDLLWVAGGDFVAALHTGNGFPLSFVIHKRTSELLAMDLLSPDDGLSQVQKLYSDGEVEIAIFRLQNLLKRFPENADLHCLMGKLLLDLFLENQSVKFYKRAAEIAPDRPDLFLNYARNVLYINDVKSLETLMKEFTTRFQGDDAYQPLLGYAYVLQGRAKEAYPLLQRYLSHHPADIECLYFMLECAMDVGELIVADEMVQKIAITIPDLPKDVRGRKADIDCRLSAAKLTVAKMVATGDAAKAVERFGEELSSDVACLCRDLGHILQMQGDRRQSEVYLAFHRVISETLMKQG